MKVAMIQLRRRFFGGVGNSVLTIMMLALIVAVGIPLIRWSLIDSVWDIGAATSCRTAAGACWAFIHEKYRLILFGRYPYAEQWRPLVAIVLILGAMLVSCDRRAWCAWLGALWVATAALAALLMWGGMLGLPYVDDMAWGGLPLTLILAVAGIAGAFPLALLLALGRRSTLPFLHAVSVAFIELVRGVPLVSVLFMASFMFPLFLPRSVSVDELLRALVAIMLFSAAYLAEAIRGGLQAIPRGQDEAATSLGFSYWQRMRLIVLPQALRLVIPPIVNIFIGLFKDTSLVSIVGLMDLLLSAKQALADPLWRRYSLEAYTFIGVLYFAFCFAMSRYSQYLERRLRIPGG